MALCLFGHFRSLLIGHQGRLASFAVFPSTQVGRESVCLRALSNSTGLSVEEQTSRLVGQTAASILYAKAEPSDVEIRVDGRLYLPEIKYRRILNQAFGPGGWALLPQTEPNTSAAKDLSGKDKRTILVSREFALFASGHLLAQGVGEHEVYGRGSMDFGRACEAAKSKALMNCCGSIGVGKNLRDKQFVMQWKTEHAHQAWAINTKTLERRIVWKRVNRDFPEPWRALSNQQ